MVRFKNINDKSILIFISDFIRKIFGGDRLKRISIQISELLNQIHKEKKKKLIILDFGCGSMELSKRIQKKIFIKKIIGTDTFEYNFKIDSTASPANDAGTPLSIPSGSFSGPNFDIIGEPRHSNNPAIGAYAIPN